MLQWPEQARSTKILKGCDSAVISIKKGTVISVLYELVFNKSRIASREKNITFMQVPAHSYIPGNQKVDKCAKELIK